MIETLVKGLFTSYEISVVSLRGDGTLIHRVRPFCKEAVNLQMRSKWDVGALYRLWKFLKKGHYEILHTFLFHANILGRILGKLLRVAVIISSQRNVDPWRKIHHVWLDRWTSSFSDVVISNSKAGQDRLVSIEKIPSQKIEVVYNGLDFSEIPVKNKHVSSDHYGVGMVGNFWGMKGEAKGYFYFIEAAQRLLKIREDVYFLLVGAGDRQKYEKRVSELGLQNHFRFLGGVTSIYEALALMDVFVLPSEWEGFPVSILEAMAFGVPVIATQVGGIPELIENGETGLLIPPRDPLAIEEAILRLLDNPVLRERLVKNAKKIVSEHFRQERMIEETQKIYLRLLNSL